MDPQSMSSFPQPALAAVIGSSGAIGAACVAALERSGRFDQVIGLGRGGTPPLDLLDEASIVAAAALLAAAGPPLRLVIDATGFLHGRGFAPEKGLRQLDAAHLAHAFAINATGPALLMKHCLGLLPRDGKSVFATLSARVGSIGDNRLGGWYSYRAAKAALNQLVRTAAIELSRSHREAVCISLHPGTVASALSAPFAKAGLEVQPPDVAAARLLAVIDRLTPADSGGFLDWRGDALPW
jgi:NAD(P)-dependent dehydrogenase (short-subunit alcohol dehydrogenase family)